MTATGVQLVLASGALLGLGVALLLARLLPVHPDLGEALDRFSPRAASRQPLPAGTGGDPGTTPATAAAAVVAGAGRAQARDRVGVWAMRVLPPVVWGRPPVRELALLRRPLARFYGDKVTYAAVGLVLIPAVTGVYALVGFRLPVQVPLLGSLVLAGVLWFLPDYNARDDARRARAEFLRSLTAYLDLVALERHAGSGVREAMEAAAEVGDSWVFARLAEELARSRWSGHPPWQALREVAEELGVRELDEVADIMRLSGEEGAQAYTSLRARAQGLRTALLSAERARANEAGDRMDIPASLLGVIFLVILIAPALLRLLAGT